MNSIKQILKSGNIYSKIKSLKPEVIFIHAGLEDIRNDSCSNEEIIDNYKQLIYNLLECSDNVKICVSLIIPTPGYPQLNNRINEVNDAITHFITWLRSDRGLKNNIYSSNNVHLSSYIARRTGSHGTELFLTERG